VDRQIDQRDRTTTAIAVVVALATIAVLVYWFVVRDPNRSELSASQTPSGDKTFQTDGVPFTFHFPSNFALAPTPAGFLWIAGIGPYDFLDVKRLTDTMRSVDTTRSATRVILEGRPGLTISDEATVTLGAATAVRFRVDATVGGQSLRSALYYFSLDGASWQLECQSTDTGRVAIAAACSKMERTFSAS
jgi:hypothetical protein